MTQILFNCDDFGKTSQVNASILKAYQEGLLRSASLMVTGKAFQEAVEIARAHPGLKVGLHLALSEAYPASPPEQIPQLIEKQGQFYSDPAKIGIKLALCQKTKFQAKSEIQRQFELFLNTGLTPTHVDGHHHLHMHPFIFKECIFWAKKMGFQRVRIAREFGSPIPPRRDSNQFLGKLLRHFVFNFLARNSQKLLAQNHIPYLDGVLGLWESGRMSEPYVLEAVSQIQDGSWEVYFHLGSEGAEEEMGAILSLKLKEYLYRHKIQIL